MTRKNQFFYLKFFESQKKLLIISLNYLVLMSAIWFISKVYVFQKLPKIKINNLLSHSCIFPSVVPLGPILFSLFINAISSDYLMI